MVPDPQLVWNGVYGNLFLFQFAFGSSSMNMHNLQLKIHRIAEFQNLSG